ncbi:hypothetical protein [Agreia sp. COWG]|uniref:hypothetical protein n=1 Tax=Agreia sp. COWG TaxID=2773266 RepID=UPI001AF3ACDA|nr:hypothetical protein [Agreia sp. COWG]CAD5996987.1 conserved membrane protein of unknown function [Agreia sp. COWG]
MSTSIPVLLAIGTVAGAIALALDVQGTAPQHRRTQKRRTRTIVMTALTVIATASLIGSLAVTSLEPDTANTEAMPPLVRVALTALALALAIVGGGPFAVLSLRLATRGQTEQGAFGGILIPQNAETHPEPRPDPRQVEVHSRFTLFRRRRLPSLSTTSNAAVTADAPRAIGTNTREVLRGGTAIGLLERVAIAGAIIAGFPEAVAVVIAIKGVGRFSELAASEAKERFIIGTLASFVWASACALIVR